MGKGHTAIAKSIDFWCVAVDVIRPMVLYPASINCGKAYRKSKGFTVSFILHSPLQLHANSNVTKRNLLGCCSKIKARHIFIGQCHFTKICWGCSIIGIYRNACKANLIKRNREIYPAVRRCNPVISPLLLMLCQQLYIVH